MVPSKTHRKVNIFSKQTANGLRVVHILRAETTKTAQIARVPARHSQSSPRALQELPRCFADASMMPPRCLPGASKMLLHDSCLLHDASSLMPPPRCLLHDASSLFPPHLYDSATGPDEVPTNRTGACMFLMLESDEGNHCKMWSESMLICIVVRFCFYKKIRCARSVHSHVMFSMF